MSEPIASALRRGDSETALSLAQALLASAPESAESHYWLALALQAKRDGAGALAAIDQAIRLAPNNDHYGLLRSMLQLGQADLGEVQAGLMDALALNPNQTEAYTGLIHIAVGHNNLPEAERLLRLAERVDAEHDSVLVAKAAILQKQGDLETALKCLTRAVEANPNHGLALCNLGLLYLQKDMPVFAEQALQRSLQTSPENAVVWRALIQSQLLQDKQMDAEQALGSLLKIVPADKSALRLRMQLRQKRQDEAAALLDAQALLALDATQIEALTQIIQADVQAGNTEQAAERIEQCLLRAPSSDALWQLRAGFEANFSGSSLAVINRWIQHCPDSAMAHEALASVAEANADFDTATKAADKALSLSVALPVAQFVKLRQEVRDDSDAALARLADLAKVARAPEAQRMILAWYGLVYDRRADYAKAAPAFRQMLQYVLPNKALPEMRQAGSVSAEKSEGYMLWAPVGVRVERLLNAIAVAAGERLLADRLRPIPERQDGFGIMRGFAGTADSRRRSILAAGRNPADCIDWMPSWDDYSTQTLQGARLVATVIDPRDALLNWMVFGSAASFVFEPDPRVSAQWLADVFTSVVQAIENPGFETVLIRVDDLDSNAAVICNELQSALGLSAAPDAELLAKPVLALGGMPNQFPAGHWRHYRDNFTEAFALLTPVAVRLGYPQE
jgi:tetratricopeptide (TPR) repeat protein